MSWVTNSGKPRMDMGASAEEKPFRRPAAGEFDWGVRKQTDAWVDLRPRNVDANRDEE